ncbi:MAG TPA: dimethylsulfonioproprionate lyase family protein [Burkholderiales bacterium]|nr:dimethylsulfonioproprionate lyase family protein [Burkholderiales bacterium]
MHSLLALCVVSLAPALAGAQGLAGADGERRGITATTPQVFEDPSMPGKEFRLQHTTYAPSGQNPKHYHPSHVVFYVLEGSGVWQEEGKEAIVLKPGDSLHVAPGTVHAHRNASAATPLVFLEFVIVEKGQRSTVPMR